MDFKNVPTKYRPIPFWSWNEKLGVNETSEQIDKMYAQGIGGFFMHARGGLETEYMSEEWFDNVETSIKRCAQNGMHPWAYDENGWPSGFGSGAVNGLGIEYQQKYLRMEDEYIHKDTHICKCGDHYFYFDVNPFYVDTLDKKVIHEFIKCTYEPYYEKFGTEIEGFFTDEPQISRDGIPWSFVFEREFKEKYGEDITEHLEELFLPVQNYTATRIKFWKMVTELFSTAYVKQIYDWCNERGLKLTGHLVLEESLYDQLTTNGACMPHYEYFSIPGMDWLGRHNTPSLTPYQVGSAARQAGKKLVLSETFAMCGHNIGHDELKWIYEYQMVRGVNLLCQHLEGYSNRGIRKRDYPPALFIQQPWWEEYKEFNDAMSRIGMLLSDGDDLIDVLVIHPQTTAWTMYDASDRCREEINKYSDKFINNLQILERKHVNFHLGDEIMLERHGSIEGKCLVIGKKKYSKVIIPEHETLFENTKRLLEEYMANGGVITDFETIEANDVIDIAEITYCRRRYDDFDMYYFVNSSENTFTANIRYGNKLMDITTGELSDFKGKHKFRKYESIVVIDDHGKRNTDNRNKQQTKLDLGGSWNIVSASENALALDYCDYYFDDILEERDGYVLNAMYRAVDRRKTVNIKMNYKIKAQYLPEKLYLAVETPEIFTIKINGKIIEKRVCGYFRDKSFLKLDISGMLRIGENIITAEVDFKQSEAVYENIEKGKLFESEKNKLTFDMEIEPMYLVGDFSVRTDGEFVELDRNVSRYKGDFVISEPKTSITLQNIERQGFPFFAGILTVKKKFNRSQNQLDFVKRGINVVKVKVNGSEMKNLLWEPYTTDLSDYLKDEENEVELTLINNLRNLLGPFHLSEGETYFCSPASFYQEECIWNADSRKERWNRNYCFANVSIIGR